MFRRPDSWTGRLQSNFDVIVRYQAALLPVDAARWRHVGVLDDHFQVWDAMPKLNVRSRPLREVLRERTVIAITRPQVPVDPVRLRTTLLMFSNHDYRMSVVPKRSAEGAVICSIFASNVLRRTTRAALFRSLPIVVPGDFAHDPMFKPAPINWCQIAM
jgi:hypothetical protein